jgi:LCP family protein required for cell wall assembly
LDARSWETDDGPPRTDTLILITIDPGTRTAGMLSIPRDLWVDIPGFGYHKINQAYFLGEANRTDGGGAGLAMETVANLLEVPIQYYAHIDFNAFVQFIDEIGGVKLDVPEPMVVDPTGDNNTRLLKPGMQTLPGDIALAYARARNTAGSDFDRSQRQQQVIMAVRQRILSFELLPSLLAKAPVLYTQLSSGVTTNLSLQQIIQLAWMAYQVPEGNITRTAIGVNQITFGTSLDGMDILYPVTEEIFKLRNQIFSTSDPESPTTVLDLSISERMVAEDANVSVRNGTETIGLAARTDIYLRDLGVKVSEVTNAEQLYANTTLIDHTGKPYTIEYLTEIFRVAPSRIYHRHEPNSEIDVIILLGEDWATNNKMP